MDFGSVLQQLSIGVLTGICLVDGSLIHFFVHELFIGPDNITFDKTNCSSFLQYCVYDKMFKYLQQITPLTIIRKP